MTSVPEVDDDFTEIKRIPVTSLDEFRARRSRSPSRQRNWGVRVPERASQTAYGRAARREQELRQAEQEEEPSILHQPGAAWSLLESATQAAASSAAARPGPSPTLIFWHNCRFRIWRNRRFPFLQGWERHPAQRSVAQACPAQALPARVTPADSQFCRAGGRQPTSLGRSFP